MQRTPAPEPTAVYPATHVQLSPVVSAIAWALQGLQKPPPGPPAILLLLLLLLLLPLLLVFPV